MSSQKLFTILVWQGQGVYVGKVKNNKLFLYFAYWGGRAAKEAGENSIYLYSPAFYADEIRYLS